MTIDKAMSLGSAILRILDIDTVTNVEELVISGDRSLIIAVTINVNRVPPERLGRTSPQTSSDYDDTKPVIPRSKINAVAEILQDELPSTVSITTGRIDFQSLADTPLIGTRVLNKENRALTPPDVTDSLMQRLIDRLANINKPFLLSSITSQAGDLEYYTTIRYGVVHRDHALAVEDDEIAHIEDGRHVDLSDAISDAGVVSNHDISIFDYVDTELGEVRYKEAKYKDTSFSKTMRRLYHGSKEFRELLQCRPGATAEYAEINLYGRITLTQPQLIHAAAFRPRYYTESPWNDVWICEKPTITIEEVVQSAPDVNTQLGTQDTGVLMGSNAVSSSPDSTVSPDSPSPPSDTNESDEHGQLSQFTVMYYESLGFVVKRVDQGGDRSVPDLIAKRDDLVIAIEVEVTNKSKAANTLKNLARNLADGYDRVVFVTPTKSYAEKIRRSLEAPYKKCDDDAGRVLLQNLSDNIECESFMPVLPSTQGESKWWLSGETLTLRTDDGELLAEGTVGEPYADFEWHTPRYRHTDGVHKIVKDHTVIESADTKRETLDGWTPVKLPVIPYDRHLLDPDRIKISYHAGDELEPLSLRLDWADCDLAVDTESKVSRYNAGINRFINKYMTAEEGTQLLYEEFRDAVQAYFDVRARVTPDASWTGRALQNVLDGPQSALPVTVDEKGADPRYINNIRFLYDAGLVSPAGSYTQPRDLDESGADADDGTAGESSADDATDPRLPDGVPDISDDGDAGADE